MKLLIATALTTAASWPGVAGAPRRHQPKWEAASTSVEAAVTAVIEENCIFHVTEGVGIDDCYLGFERVTVSNCKERDPSDGGGKYDCIAEDLVSGERMQIRVIDAFDELSEEGPRQYGPGGERGRPGIAGASCGNGHVWVPAPNPDVNDRTDACSFAAAGGGGWFFGCRSPAISPLPKDFRELALRFFGSASVDRDLVLRRSRRRTSTRCTLASPAGGAPESRGRPEGRPRLVRVIVRLRVVARCRR